MERYVCAKQADELLPPTPRGVVEVHLLFVHAEEVLSVSELA
jgi:hypothetical protein